ncbi:MAG: ABC transporter substrate-binding protein [Lacrimispora sp.]|uniref:ABC transporter substrate-binding protein n=1 Tax=Lacrimispora sp. TaxID=2719234 RepID=UPI0039E5649F
MKRTLSLILALTLSLSSLTACAPQQSPTAAATQPSQTAASTEAPSAESSEAASGERTVTILSDGTQAQVPAVVDKVAAIFGPAYERLVVLGAEDKIVMASASHKKAWPWSNLIYKRLGEIDVLENGTDLDTEVLLNKGTQVAFCFGNPQTVEAINRAGMVAVPWDPSPEPFDNIKGILFRYADIVGGDAPERAQKYADYFDEKMKLITDYTNTLTDEQKPTVYFASSGIERSVGADSDVTEMIAYAGGTSLSKEIPGHSFVDVSLEQIISWNPDHIFVDHIGVSQGQTIDQVLAELTGDPKFASLQAVKDGRVYASPVGVFYWDSGVQCILQLMWMAQKLHPEAFTDINMAEEVKYFYQEFFDYELTDEQAQKILNLENP